MTKLILKLAVVFSGQSVMAWLFYRSRALSHSFWTDSDVVVFGLPLAVGFSVSAWILFLGFPPMAASLRMTAIFGLSGVGAVISSYVGTVIAFNLYGA